MRLKRVAVENYRNIHGITVHLNQDCSYVIGENNVGKSNFLDMLSTVCRGESFSEWDFDDAQRDIIIELELELRPLECDLFPLQIKSEEEKRTRKVLYTQCITEGIPTIIDIETGTPFSSRLARRINYVSHKSVASEGDVLVYEKRLSKLLFGGILGQYIASSNDSSSLLTPDRVSSLAQFISSQVESISAYSKHSVGVPSIPSLVEILWSLFSLSDKEGARFNMGQNANARHMAVASLSVLTQIMDLYQSRSTSFEKRLCTNRQGQKILSIILSIDEPEVHLHPYQQRALIGHYQKILHNKDALFSNLLKQLFGVDVLDGQLIVVTHSTDALLGDYRNLVRFYRQGKNTAVISGCELNSRMNSKHEKHLIMHFPEIKEAFYAHCALLLEGETEYGCIHSFAEKLGVSLSDYGICVINARGEGTIAPLRRLLKFFAVPSVAIYDGDVRDTKVPTEGDFFTEEPCFEIEMVKTLYDAGNPELIRQIVLDLDPDAEYQLMTADFVRKPFKKMSRDLADYTPKRLSDVDRLNREEFIELYASWFMRKKGVFLGRVMGELVPPELIPFSYRNAIFKAQEVAIASLAQTGV